MIKNSRAHFFFVLVLSVVFAANAQQKTGLSPLEVDSFIVKTMRESGIVGLGAAVIIDEKVVWSKGYGYADLETKKPFTTRTVMNIGSVAKNFTGVCLMKAVEDGRLSLDEDINKYLPFPVRNPNFPDEKITLRQLVTHSSTLTDRDPFYGETYNYTGGRVEELGSFMQNYFDPKGKYYSKENFLNYKPGTYYQYANIPAALAGYIVEYVTGKTLQTYGQELIFKPLQLKQTGWSVQQITLADHSKLYERKGDTLNLIPLYTFPTYPEGGVRSSVQDLSAYFIMLLNNGSYNGVRILKSSSVQEMKRFQFNAANKPENMNIAKLNSGIFWSTKLGATRVGHNGSDPGVRVFMLTDLKEEISVVLFINTSIDDEAVPFQIYEILYKFGTDIKTQR
ncbi:MAG: serine hydrolase domain-containing protein [Chitinophagaceae bacterium]